MKELSNDKITIQIADHGAELISICANETEYLWQANEVRFCMCKVPSSIQFVYKNW